MNETFNFNRFWTYFKYDLKQMWRNHSKAAIMIGGASAIFYVVWVLFSLVFFQHWTSPVIYARFGVLVLAFAVLEFYQAYTYGYLTDKKKGSAWLMIPASKAEKFVSMLLITLIVIPLLFFAVYFLIDGILSLVDPTYGKALISGFLGTYSDIINGLSSIGGESAITFTPGTLLFSGIVSVFINFLYFLLCGICFKKNKIVGAIAIMLGLSLVLSLISGFFMIHFVQNAQFNFDGNDPQAFQWLANLMNVSVFISCLLTVGLGWGVWRRIKTIQH